MTHQTDMIKETLDNEGMWQTEIPKYYVLILKAKEGETRVTQLEERGQIIEDLGKAAMLQTPPLQARIIIVLIFLSGCRFRSILFCFKIYSFLSFSSARIYIAYVVLF